MSNPFLAALSNLQDTQQIDEDMTNTEYAFRRFLNPRIPKALRDDPTGEFHFQHQITDSQGKPLANIRNKQPIPLYIRWYQSDIVDAKETRVVIRCGRRTGKSFSLGVRATIEALRGHNAKVLLLTPNESQIKVLFDDYIRPLLRTYRHKKSGAIGIVNEPSGIVPSGHDFIITKDTQKPQEIIIKSHTGNISAIRGMIISDAARGQSATVVIVDEADYAPNEKLQGIVTPITMTSPLTKILLSSTPSGRRDSQFYKACTDSNSEWKHIHHTFKVLPHFNKELWDLMVKESGGEESNAFQQEYLAEFGSQTEGVFNQEALNKALIISPYISVLEKIDKGSGMRSPLIAAELTHAPSQTLAAKDALSAVDYSVPGSKIGAMSVWRPEFKGHGYITVGTDWNDLAGMQTAIVWWPPEEWLKDGRLRVSRFAFNGTEPITTSRAKDRTGAPVEFKIGHTNGDAGGVHDLSRVKGILIWHGRLESGDFTWQSAANRVIGILSIPSFVNAWYVDQGYGSQVNKLIEGIMESGEYIPDMKLLNSSRKIEEPLLNRIREFSRDSDNPEAIYKTVSFGEPYKHRDIDFKLRGDRYKDVLVSLAKRMLVGREILIPYGELKGLYSEDALGSYHLTAENGSDVTLDEQDADTIEPTGGSASGDRVFGGLITQMREWRVDGYSANTMRPIYSGADHAIDAFMLALLAWWENYSPEMQSNMFRREFVVHGDITDEMYEAVRKASRDDKINKLKGESIQYGAYATKSYKDEKAPLKALMSGKVKAEQVGMTLAQMLKARFES